jgi:hypothetical protein
MLTIFATATNDATTEAFFQVYAHDLMDDNDFGYLNSSKPLKTLL